MAELKISGSGSLSAGNEYYDYVGISGSGRISGDLNCKEIKISGSGKIDGNVACDGEIKISGSGVVVGNVRASAVRTSGSSKFDKNVKCDEFKITGAGKVLGDIDCTNLMILGAASLANASASERAYISGAAKVSGLLNAESVEINLNGGCNINEIGCTNLTVKRHSGEDNVKVKIFNLPIITINNGGGKGNLTAGTVEGDDIDIEYTSAKVVRGARVRIGKGCNIERVEYSESVDIDSGSEVGEQVQI